MKKIKNLYKLLLLLPLAFIVSCDGNDDLQDVVTFTKTTPENTVFIETDDASEIIRTVPGNVAQPIEVGINNALTEDLIVSFSVIKDGVAAVEDVDYTLADATILSSEYFGSTEVTFLTQGIYEVTVQSSSSEELVVVGNKAIFNVPPAVTISIKWDDSFYDYDLYLVSGNQDLGGEVLANTFDTIAFETFDVYPPEGYSSVFIDDWWDDNASIDVEMTVEVDGVETSYPVVMDQDKFVLVIYTTFDDDGNPTYEFTPL